MNAQRWEYHRIELIYGASLSWLNTVGEAGWELVSVAVTGNLYSYYFKRPLP